MKTFLCTPLSLLGVLAVSIGCVTGSASDNDEDRIVGKGDSVCGVDKGFGPECLTFERFAIYEGGLCAAELDCHGFIELWADGTLRQDMVGNPGASYREAVISGTDLAGALAVRTDPGLFATLSAAEPPCPLPHDFSEQMAIQLAGDVYSNSTTFCDAPELAAAREALRTLAAQYLGGEFVSFRISNTAFCSATHDCNGFVELLADGTLRQDRLQEIPTVVRETKVSAKDFKAVLDVIMAPESLSGLASDPPCDVPTDIHEVMTLSLTTGLSSQITTFCGATYLASLRGAMQFLADKYLPLE
jgi:hypothetical protein